MADLDTGLLTESVRLDDIGQGQTQLLAPILVRDTGALQVIGPIKVQDVLTVQRVGVGNLETGILTEQIRLADAADSWAQLGSEEFVAVRDVLTAERIGDLARALTETLRVQDVLSAQFESPVPAIVRLTSVGVELGLGGRVRDILVNEDFTQGVWPLSELQRTTFKDISGKNNHATLNGTGFTRGVPTGLPEQALGLTFDGNGYLSVPDDGITTGGMSLANGSMDIPFRIKTTHNSATERTIIVKRNAAGTNGWYVGLVSGTIRFQLLVGGSSIFNFSRGAIADGAWHDVACYYDPPTQEARIFIDGVQSGATVVTSNTDPPYVVDDLYIGGNDPAGAVGFIGSLAFVGIGREGNLALGPALHAASVWTNVYTDVRLNPGIRIRYGSSGSLVTDWVASSGVCSVVLDNSAQKGNVGRWSPNHANCTAGFALGIPLRVTFVYGATTRYKFQGRIVSIGPEPGPVGGRSSRGVRVTATDWLDVAARSRYIGAEAQVGQISTDVLKYLMDFADQSPGNVSIDTGTQLFGYALDQGRGDRDTILGEMGRLSPSEPMYLFMRGNDTDGMTLVVSTRFARSADTLLDATFTDTMQALDVSVSASDIINDVRATCYPPVVDAAATSVLFSLTANSTVMHAIPPLDSVTIDAPYTDPNDRPSSVGGTAMVTPVPTTDYTGNSEADGTGTDMTASLSVAITPIVTAMRVVITNTSAATIFLTKLQLRGKGIYRYQAAPAIALHPESIQKYGTTGLDLDMPYQQSVAIAYSLANDVKDIYGLPTTRPSRMTIAANHDDTLMTQALVREVGDRIGIAETISGLATGDGYYIHEVELECTGLHDLRVTWGLIPPWPERLLLSYTGPAGTQTHDLDVAPLVLTDNGDYTFVWNKLGDTISITGVAGGGGGGAGSDDSGEVNTASGGGGGGGAVQTAGITVVVAVSTYTGKVGVFGAGATVSRADGAAGGITEFRVPSGTIHMQLPGGGGGGGGVNTTGGAGGSASGAGTGLGNVSGTAGGRGGDANVNNDTAGTANPSGAAGGGGAGSGGSIVSAGSAGGNGMDQNGGAGGAPANNGVSASGAGGLGNGSSAGGGGGGGGGVLLDTIYRGGGGGGGAGGASGSAGGNGGAGILIITKV